MNTGCAGYKVGYGVWGYGDCGVWAGYGLQVWGMATLSNRMLVWDAFGDYRVGADCRVRYGDYNV